MITYYGYHRDTSVQYDGLDEITRRSFQQIRTWFSENVVMYDNYPDKEKVTVIEHWRKSSDSDSEATRPFEDDPYASSDGSYHEEPIKVTKMVQPGKDKQGKWILNPAHHCQLLTMATKFHDMKGYSKCPYSDKNNNGDWKASNRFSCLHDPVHHHCKNHYIKGYSNKKNNERKQAWKSHLRLTMEHMEERCTDSLMCIPYIVHVMYDIYMDTKYPQGSTTAKWGKGRR